MPDNPHVNVPYIKNLTNFWRESVHDRKFRTHKLSASINRMGGIKDYSKKVAERRTNLMISNVNRSMAGNTQKFLAGSWTSNILRTLMDVFGIKTDGVAMGVVVGIYAFIKSILR